MDFIKHLKKAFPKPNIPQKRYLIVIVAMVYYGMQLYVQNTPDKYDDALVEKAHDLALQLLADNARREDNQEFIQQYFGERD